MSDPHDGAAGAAASETHPDHHAPTIARNVRYGLVLFAVYLVFYAGFIALAAFAPARMKQPAVGGINLAILYGIGLIVMAFVLALIYMIATRLAHTDDDDKLGGTK
jgi:uncharacterized membrane protein (DUF485 family)